MNEPCKPAGPTRAVADDLDLLEQWLELDAPCIVEAGCGSARLLRTLLERHPGCRAWGLEVDARQHAKNLAAPQAGLVFVAAPAQAIPADDASFDLALMLKSLHHVPPDAMDDALIELRRVLRPGGHLYVSEPVYGGALNEIVRLFNDEGRVRAAAQAALDRAVARGHWLDVAAQRFDVPVHYRDFAEFEQRMVDVTFAERRFDAALRAAVRARFDPHLGSDGARFERPMLARLLRRAG